jgi:hypothetical protein
MTSDSIIGLVVFLLGILGWLVIGLAGYFGWGLVFFVAMAALASWVYERF